MVDSRTERYYNSETVAIPLQIFKDVQEIKMQTVSLHRLISKQAHMVACQPAYWSLFSIGLDNDRTPETSGFLEVSVS